MPNAAAIAMSPPIANAQGVLVMMRDTSVHEFGLAHPSKLRHGCLRQEDEILNSRVGKVAREKLAVVHAGWVKRFGATLRMHRARLRPVRHWRRHRRRGL
jgi:hypothetical protein